jgi:hypothetical protein
LALGVPAVLGPRAFAQEAVFRNTAHQYLSAQTRSAIETMPYTFRVRDLRVIVTPTLGIEWNDNVFVSDANKDWDVSFSPRLDLHAIHPLGANNRLSLDVGVGYQKYVRNDELDRLLITPGSTFDFDFAVGDVRFNVHDRLTYELDPVANGAVAGTGSYGGLDNMAGTMVSWQLHRINLSAGYDFIRFISESDDQSYLDRITHACLARIGVEVYPDVIVGTEASAAPTSYDDSYLNDSIGYSLGGYADWKVTDHFTVAPRGGYSLTTFSTSDVLGDQPDYSGFYFGLNVDHRPNETISYHLAADRKIQPGANANLTDTYAATLAVTWAFIRDLPFTTSIFYENGKQTGGGLAESWVRYSGSISLNQEITRRLNASVSYGLTYRDSDLADRDYLQNRVTFTLAYRL